MSMTRKAPVGFWDPAGLSDFALHGYGRLTGICRKTQTARYLRSMPERCFQELQARACRFSKTFRDYVPSSCARHAGAIWCDNGLQYENVGGVQGQ